MYFIDECADIHEKRNDREITDQMPNAEIDRRYFVRPDGLKYWARK
jgi:hypothetical protein